MWTLLLIELFKVFRRSRTYISFAAIGAIVLLIQLAFYVDGEAYIGFMLQSLNDTFSVEGNVLNGYLISFIVLQTLLVHVPLLIALVAGDMIAGEANMGTLRLLVSKPVSRTSLVLSKFLASTCYTLLLLFWMAILSLVVSVVVFGVSDLIVFKSEMITILEKEDILWRYFAAFGFAAIAMTTVAALALFLSVFADNSIGPIISTMSLIIVFTILTTMELPFFNTLKPYIFTTHMLGWKGFFDEPVHYESIFRSGVILLLHIVIFVGATVLIFKKKDVLS